MLRFVAIAWFYKLYIVLYITDANWRFRMMVFYLATFVFKLDVDITYLLRDFSVFSI